MHVDNGVIHALGHTLTLRLKEQMHKDLFILYMHYHAHNICLCTSMSLPLLLKVICFDKSAEGIVVFINKDD